jgi:hypothetical protein
VDGIPQKMHDRKQREREEAELDIPTTLLDLKVLIDPLLA